MTGCANCGHAWLDHVGGEHCTRCSCEVWDEPEAMTAFNDQAPRETFALQRVQPSVFGPDPEVIAAIWCMISWPGAYNRVEWTAPAAIQSRLRSPWVEDFAATEPRDWTRVVTTMCEDRDVNLSVGLRPKRGFGTCGSARVLWAHTTTKKETAELAKLRPRPSLVIREGDTARMTALWELREPLSYDWLVRANRRLAHRLFGPKKFCGPEFSMPAPGSCLRVGRARPVPVRVEEFNPAAIYHPREVVGHLREAPDANAWREAVAA